MLTSADFLHLWKPKRPLATNDFAHGLFRHRREQALEMRFVETAPKSYQNLVVLDFDSPTASWDIKSLVWDDGKLPEPSFITVNPASDHAHAGWFVQGGAYTDKARTYLDDIFRKFKKVSGSDPNYTGLTMRNPVHDWQQTEWMTDHLYSLSELHSVVKEVARPSQVQDFMFGEGRNAAIFGLLRSWAYSNRRHYPESYEVWEDAVIQRSFALNGEEYPEYPLPSSELVTISRSVALYVWKHEEFTAKGFSERQRRVSALAAHVAGAPVRYTEALIYSDAGLNARDIGEALNLTSDTAKKLVQRAKRWKLANPEEWLSLSVEAHLVGSERSSSPVEANGCLHETKP